MSDGPISVKIDPLLAELVPKFLGRCKQTVVEFQNAVRSGDFSSARRIGHALYGTASSFGFDEMAGIGKETLQINPGDPAVRRAKELARRYQGLEKDRAFYDVAESIPFRKVNE